MTVTGTENTPGKMESSQGGFIRAAEIKESNTPH
jgi:hypothetical protein